MKNSLSRILSVSSAASGSLVHLSVVLSSLSVVCWSASEVSAVVITSTDGKKWRVLSTVHSTATLWHTSLETAV